MRTESIRIRLKSMTSLACMLFTNAGAHAQSCPGDIVPDGRIDGLDLGVLLAYWGPTSAVEISHQADLNQDLLVDGVDLGLLLSSWGFCAPAISSFTPPFGCYLGGTQITISGSWLAQTQSVTIGGNECTGVVPISSTMVRATVPFGVVGDAPVVVRTPGGTASAPTSFVYGTTDVAAIVPSAGSVSGGAMVTITGSYLAGTTSVKFGGVPATSFTVVNDTRLVAVTPVGSIGAVDVEITGAKGSVTITDGFRYVSIVVPQWAEMLAATPDPGIVVSPTLRAAIESTGYAWRVRDLSTGIEMMLVPPGSFQMGCSPSLQSPCSPHGDTEVPVHEVILTSAFYIGRYEVTQSEWTARMGTNPSAFFQYPDSGSRPVEAVSWNMAQDFLAAVSMRLPTEAEWEYACRAGTTTAFSNGSDDEATIDGIAWFDGNAGGQTRPVGLKSPNGLGLHDMHGNVWEWVSDWVAPYQPGTQVDPVGPSTGNARVFRGGSWYGGGAAVLRSSQRWAGVPQSGLWNVGFRVVRNP